MSQLTSPHALLMSHRAPLTSGSNRSELSCILTPTGPAPYRGIRHVVVSREPSGISVCAWGETRMSTLMSWCPGRTIGRGVDSLTGGVKAELVQTPNIAAASQAAGAITSIEFNRIESEEDLSKALQIDASASARFGLFSADARMTFASAQKIHTYSLFTYLYVNVQRNYREIVDAHMSPDAAVLRVKPDQSSFRSAYGDAYVVGERSGGELFVVIEIKSRSQDDKSSLDASLSGSYGAMVSIDAKLKTQFERSVSNREMRLSIYQAGGTPVLSAGPDDKPRLTGDLLAVAANFLKELTDPDEVKARAVPFEVLILPTETLPVADAPSAMDIASAMELLDLLARNRKTTHSLLADVEYAVANSSQFNWGQVGRASLSEAKAAQVAYEDRIVAINREAQKVANDRHYEPASIGALSPGSLPTVLLPDQILVSVPSAAKGAELEAALVALGLKAEITGQYSPNQGNSRVHDLVIAGSIDPPAGTQVLPGSVVSFTRLVGEPIPPSRSADHITVLPAPRI